MIHLSILELILIIAVVIVTTVWALVAYQLRYDSNETEHKLGSIELDLAKLTRLVEWHTGTTFDQELERQWHGAVTTEAKVFDPHFGEWHVPSRDPLAGLNPDQFSGVDLDAL